MTSFWFLQAKEALANELRSLIDRKVKGAVFLS